MKSPKTFDFSAIDFDTDAGIAINLGELEDMSLHQKVTADVKVLVVDEPVTFSSSLPSKMSLLLTAMQLVMCCCGKKMLVNLEGFCNPRVCMQLVHGVQPGRIADSTNS